MTLACLPANTAAAAKACLEAKSETAKLSGKQV